MKPGQFALDRLPLLLAFTVALLFILLVLHLTTGPLSLGDVLYALLLGGVSCVIIIGVDWFRHRQFRAALARLAAGDMNVILPRGANREQRVVRTAIEGVRSHYLDRIKASEAAADNHRAFIDHWVHQMKTPLAVLDLGIQSSRDADELARIVASETAQLHEGLELMLATARLERFELDLRPARVELGALVRETVNELKSSWIRNGVFPRVQVPEQTVSVSSDAKWLKVVLRQLLTNAIKYSKQGSTVEIGVATDDDGTRLSVKDSGIGIPPEDLPRVFDQFFTGSNGRLKPAATGMGLHLASRICLNLGHELTARSTPGVGSEFIVTFKTRSLTDL